MIHDGPANYTHGTAKQFLSLVFSFAHAPRGGPPSFFALTRRNYPREKIAKNAIFPFSPSSLPLPAPFSFSPLDPERKYAPVMTRHFAAILSARPLLLIAYWYTILYHQPTRYKSHGNGFDRDS